MDHDHDDNLQNKSSFDVFECDESNSSPPNDTFSYHQSCANEKNDVSLGNSANISPVLKTPIIIKKEKSDCYSENNSTKTLRYLSQKFKCSTPAASRGKSECESGNVISSLATLIDRSNISWTSSLATPVQGVKSVLFDTDERQTRMPTEEEKESTPVASCSANRVLFTDDMNADIWDEFINSTPEEKSIQGAETSPVLGRHGQTWYWADSQKLICKTPCRRLLDENFQQSLRSFEPRNESCHGVKSNKKDFLFDSDSSPDSIFQVTHLVDPAQKNELKEMKLESESEDNAALLLQGIQRNVGTECEDGFSKCEYPIKSSPNTISPLLCVVSQNEKHTIKGDEPKLENSVSQFFSHDLSASVLEEVCIATEIGSPNKMCASKDTKVVCLKTHEACNELSQNQGLVENLDDKNENIKSSIETLLESPCADDNIAVNKGSLKLDKELHEASEINICDKFTQSDLPENVIDSPNNVKILRRSIQNKINCTLYSSLEMPKDFCHTVEYEDIIKCALDLEEAEKLRICTKGSRKFLQPNAGEFVPFNKLTTDRTSSESSKVNENYKSSRSLKDNELFNSVSFEKDIILNSVITVVQESEKEIANECRSPMKGLEQVDVQSSVNSKFPLYCSPNLEKSDTSNCKSQTIASLEIYQNQFTKTGTSSPENIDINDVMNGISADTEFQRKLINEEETHLEKKQRVCSSNVHLSESKIISPKGNENYDYKCKTLFNDCSDILSAGSEENTVNTQSEVTHYDIKVPNDNNDLCSGILNSKIITTNALNLDSSMFWPDLNEMEVGTNVEEVSKKDKFSLLLTPKSREIVENKQTLKSISSLKESTSNSKNLVSHKNEEILKFPLETIIDTELSIRGKSKQTVNHTLMDVDSQRNDTYVPIGDKRVAEEIGTDRKRRKIDLEPRKGPEHSTNKGLNSLKIPFETVTEYYNKVNYKVILQNKNEFLESSNTSEYLLKSEYVLKNNSDTNTLNLFKKSKNLSEGNFTHVKTNEFKGFSTASGKKVVISDDSIKKGKKLLEAEDVLDTNTSDSFNELENVSEDSFTPNRPNEFKGFSTASSKKVVISDVSMKKAKKLLEDEDGSKEILNTNTSNFLNEVENVSDKTVTPLRTNEFKGFSTASDKKVVISDDSMKKAKKLLEAEDVLDSNTSVYFNKLENFLEETVTPLRTNEFKGFSIPSGKKMVISDDSMKKAKKLFEDENSLKEISNTNTSEFLNKLENVSDETVTPLRINEFKGFSTANGKKVVISDDSIKKAKKLLEDEDGLKEISNTNTSDFWNEVENVSEETVTPLRTNEFKGFSTANGKKVVISDDSIKKAKKLLEDEDGLKEISNTNTSDFWNELENVSDETVTPLRTNEFKGFSTASGKKVVISDDSMKKAKKLLEDENSLKEISNTITSDFLNEVENVSDETVTPLRTNELNGFSTASGKKVVISDDSMRKAKKLLEDENSLREISNTNTSDFLNKLENVSDETVTPLRTNKFKGFSTASGKKVVISDDSMKKAKKLLEDENSLKEISNTITSDFLNEVETVSDETVTPLRTNEFKEFSAASGKKVVISYDSIKKAIKLLESENILDTCTTNFSNKLENVLEKTDFPLRTNEFKGFSTASGKKVVISDDSMKKAKKLLEDEEVLKEISNTITSDFLNEVENISDETVTPLRTNEFKGFSTASGKNVVISDDSMKKAKKLLEDENSLKEMSNTITSDYLNEVENVSGETVTPLKTNEFKGFSAASGKKVVICYDSIKKTMKLPESENVLDTCTTNFSNKLENVLEKTDFPLRTNEFRGFSTASGKKVVISDDSMKKAKKLFEAQDVLDTNTSVYFNKLEIVSEETLTPLRTNEFKGFSTASGKKVVISDDSMKKAKKLFEAQDVLDTNTSVYFNKLENVSEETVTPLRTNEFKGFSTASGKKVVISDDSMKKAKKLFETQDVLDTNTSVYFNKLEIVSEETLTPLRTNEFKGFSTASGKNVVISDDSMKKAKKLFETQDVLDTNTSVYFNKLEIVSEETLTPLRTNEFKGFSTASGKKVVISDDSMKKGKKLFEAQDVLDTNTSVYFNKLENVSEETLTPLRTNEFKGFSTASGKKVVISDDSMKKAKKLFEAQDVLDINTSVYFNKLENVSEETVTPLRTNEFKGFSTASGKKVVISDDSMKKAKKIFEAQDVLDTNTSVCFNKLENLSEETVTPLRTNEFRGFSTASGKKVVISDDSIKKAKKLLEAEDVLKEILNTNTSDFLNEVENVSEETVAPFRTFVESNEFKGFATERSKEFVISDGFIKKARKFLETESVLEETADTNFSHLLNKSGNISEENITPNKTNESKVLSSTNDTNGINNGKCLKSIDVDDVGTQLYETPLSDFSNELEKIVFVSPMVAKELNGFLKGSRKRTFIEKESHKSSQAILEFCGTPEDSFTATNLKYLPIFRKKNDKNTEENVAGVKSLLFQKDLEVYDNTLSVIENSTVPSQNLCNGTSNYNTSASNNIEGTSSVVLGTEEKNVVMNIKIARDMNNTNTQDVVENMYAIQLCESSSSVSSDTINIVKMAAEKITSMDVSVKDGTNFLERDNSLKICFDKIHFPEEQFVNNLASERDCQGMGVSQNIKCSSEVTQKEMQWKGTLPKPFERNSEYKWVGGAPSDVLLITSSLEEVIGREFSSNFSLTQCTQNSMINGKSTSHIKASSITSPAQQCTENMKSQSIACVGSAQNRGGVSRKLCFLDLPEGSSLYEKVSPRTEAFVATSSDCSNSPRGRNTLPELTRPPESMWCCATAQTTGTPSPRSAANANLSQEVQECISAFLADELELGVAKDSESGRETGEAAINNTPAWARSLVTCPDMLNDRGDAPTPLLSAADPNEDAVPTPSSPILGRSDRFGRRRRVARRLLQKSVGAASVGNADSVCSSSGESISNTAKTPTSTSISHQMKTSSFKVPYKTLETPTGSRPCDSDSSSCKRTAPSSSSITGASLPKRKCPAPQPPRQPNVLSLQPPPPPSENVRAGRVSAAVAQQEAVAAARERWRARGRSNAPAGPAPRPCVGSWLLRKRTELARRVSWRAATRGLPPARYTRTALLAFGMKENVINVTSENARHFMFSAWEFYSPKLSTENVNGIPVGDGANLILNEESKVGVVEVERAFLSSPGVEPGLVPNGWVENHFRWLVWKLAATERSFPHIFAGRCLTPNVLLLQLKYRYDREIDLCQRPALRRIVEKDDSAGKRLVLCVAAIIPVTNENKNLESHISSKDTSINDAKSKGQFKIPTSNCELLLTDGWYSIRTIIDLEMCRLVHSEHVTVGTKLVTQGAELLNCEEGCYPLEMSPTVRFKIHTNSTRRAHWDARLGFQNYCRPLPIHLNTVLPNGGFASCVRVVIARVYPIFFMEKLPNGKTVLHTERVEMRIAAQFDKHREKRLEQLYSQERSRFSQEQKKKSRITARKLELITSGQELCELLDSDPDPSSLQSLLTSQQLGIIQEFQQTYRERKMEELQSRLQQLISEDSSISRTVTRILKIRCLDARSRSSSKTAILTIWRPSEDITQLLTEGSMFKVCGVTASGTKMGCLQLTAGRQSQYIHVPLSRPVPYYPRRVCCIDEILSKNFQSPFNELDTVGVVVHISADVQGSSHFQTVYLSDADMRILGISFWGGLKEYGWEDLLEKTSFIAASNLQLRQISNKQRTTCVYATEYSTFSLNPRQPHLKEGLKCLRQNVKMDLNQFSLTCEELVLRMNETAARESNSYSKLPTTLTLHEADGDNANLLSTPIHQKLLKLDHYGDPPPVSPLYLPCDALKKRFKVPCRTSTIGSPQELENSCERESPPLSLDEPG